MTCEIRTLERLRNLEEERDKLRARIDELEKLIKKHRHPIPFGHSFETGTAIGNWSGGPL